MNTAIDVVAWLALPFGGWLLYKSWRTFNGD
jgi:hypothetical protein